ncbi:MAG: GNAT family N-acetyltransferase [Spirochaetales bacterium]|nr:GNAT family N-acetyltransferase [Spirochaetales bacterium]
MQTIRPVADGDLDAVFAVIQNAISAMQRDGIEQWDEVYPSRAVIAADIDRRAMYLIEVERAVAGIIVFDERQPKEYGGVSWRHRGRVSTIHRLTVHPAFQRRGIASRLMSFAEAEIASQGYNVVRLDAYEGNPGALALYERLGYRPAGRVRFRKGVFRCFEKRLRDVSPP